MSPRSTLLETIDAELTRAKRRAAALVILQHPELTLDQAGALAEREGLADLRLVDLTEAGNAPR